MIPREISQLVVENVKIALAELRANPFRSALTTLGIVIAVSAVIAVVSIVQGASKFMLDQIEGLGSNSFWVFQHRSGTSSSRSTTGMRSRTVVPP